MAVLGIDREHVLERDRWRDGCGHQLRRHRDRSRIQMATGTFSARIMRLLYRDRWLKATLAVLVGTFTYSFSVLQRIEDDFVPDLGETLGGFFISLSLLVFIVFFDRFIRHLKPVAVAANVASTARSTFAANLAHCGSDGHPVGARDDARIRHSSCERAAAAQSKLSIPTVSSSGLARAAPSLSCRTR
jgi:Predicted membrane protein (DUF2254)